MYIDNFEPSFVYNDHGTLFNYAVQDLLVDILRENKSKLIDSNGVKVLVLKDSSYIVYVSSDVDSDSIFEAKSNVLNLNNYNMVVAKALRNGGVFSMLDGFNALELAEDLSKYSNLSVTQIMDIYKSKISAFSDESKNEQGEFLANSIPKLYALAKKTNQVKIDDSNNYDLKDYCDCDFSIFTYNNKFMISCSASANLYLVDFNDDGFVVYGHSNDYGKELEAINNKEFEWDTADLEPYYLKYLNDNMIIMTVNKGNVQVLNSLVSMLHSIVEFIIEEENI